MKLLPYLAAIWLLHSTCIAQELSQTLQQYETDKQSILQELAQVDSLIEDTKLALVRADIMAFGLPGVEAGEEVIHHTALSLVYSEEQEEAKWVAHSITPEVITGTGGRTNDFRPDPKVKTGTAVEKDYFLKSDNGKGGFDYDGYGCDRGHLAPSADFRWSKKALSESYFYSNMSPQLPGFNREIWAGLENAIRAYLYRNPTSTLHVVTGPILSPDLPKVTRSVNGVSIPEFFFKVIIDRTKGTGIGFLVPHKEDTEDALEAYAVSIDIVEKASGLDFFEGLPDEEENQLEAQNQKMQWLPNVKEGDVASFTLSNIPRKKAYPATMAKKFMGKGTEITVCGTVVGGRYSRKGNLLLNLDKQFPNQIFTIFVRKENLPNFSYDPLMLKNKKVCSIGKIKSIGGTPTMYLDDEHEIEVLGQ